MVVSGNALEFEQEIGDNDSPSSSVVTAVCAVTGKHPQDAPLLADCIDPDCLNEMFRGERQPTVTFTYDGQEVVVESDRVRVLAD